MSDDTARDRSAATAWGDEYLNGPRRAPGVAWIPVENVGIDEGIMTGMLTVSHVLEMTYKH